MDPKLRIGLQRQTRLPDMASIYTAELQALKMAFYHVENSADHDYIIFTDSLSSLMALKSNQSHHPYVSELLQKYSDLVRLNKTVVLAWVPSHVGIKGNEKADTLAKEALNLEISNIKIPHTDFKPNINKFIKNKWQSVWDTFPNNKLYEIQFTVGLSDHYCSTKRRDEIVFARTKIGHTYLTHAYLLKSEETPQCIPCNCPFTIKHLLLECTDYMHVRHKYFNIPDLKTLIQDVTPNQILSFLKEIDLYNQF